MRVIDVFTVSLRNLFRQKARTVLTIVSMMIGAFLVSIVMSSGNGLERFMISQVTMFSNARTIAISPKVDYGESMGFGFGGGVEEYEDESAEEEDAGEQLGIPSGEDQDSSSTENAAEEDIPVFILERTLGIDDIEEAEKVDHVTEVAFEAVVPADYIRLADDEGGKYKISLYGFSDSLREEMSFSAIDRDLLLDEKFSIVLSDGYAEGWEKDRDDLVGEKVMVQVTQTGEIYNLGGPMASGGSDSDAETKEFEFVIAGFMEKSLLSQLGMISPEASREVNAFIADRSVEDYTEAERAYEAVVIVDSDENVKAVDKELEELGYNSMTYDETIGQIGVIFDFISVALSSFGIVALIVASIGVINTLLMAIYERTREIGVMKAVGATRSNIGALFTAEAAWLGIFGGGVGLLVSWGLGQLVNYILHDGFTFFGKELIKAYLSDYPTFNVSVFSLDIIMLVMVVTTVVATLAGLYPSWRASRLDPIDALRHD